MLPRLRIMITAALIAALPWLLLGGGVVTTAQNGAPTNELSRPNAGLTLSAGDVREAHRMHILAYVRRSRELEQLRDMASAPLSEWIAAPAGVADPDSPPQPERQTKMPIEVANLPPVPTEAEPAESDETQRPDPGNAQQQPAPEQKPATDQVSEPASPAPQPAPAPEVTGSIQPQIDLPLPRAKPVVMHVKRHKAQRPRFTTARIAYRAQAKIAYRPEPLPFKPNPFAGPPATPTLVNPSPERYGSPQ